MTNQDDTGLLKAVEIDAESLIYLLTETMRRGGCGVLAEAEAAREALLTLLDAMPSGAAATNAGS